MKKVSNFAEIKCQSIFTSTPDNKTFFQHERVNVVEDQPRKYRDLPNGCFYYDCKEFDGKSSNVVDFVFGGRGTLCLKSRKVSQSYTLLGCSLGITLRSGTPDILLDKLCYLAKPRSPRVIAYKLSS